MLENTGGSLPCIQLHPSTRECTPHLSKLIGWTVMPRDSRCRLALCAPHVAPLPTNAGPPIYDFIKVSKQIFSYICTLMQSNATCLRNEKWAEN
jgi:hypothetical protein